MKTANSIKNIALRLNEIKEPNDPFLRECADDSRKGVADLVKRWTTNYQKQLAIRERFEEMSMFEHQLQNEGFLEIAGIDEVGRGPLAGPVVASAVILPLGFYLPGLDDSKKVSEAKREAFYSIIMEQAIAVGTGLIHSEEIDEINIYQASKKAMLAAITDLNRIPDYLLIDAMELAVPMPQMSLIKGDSRSISIAAASIVAKVTRDRMMKEYSVEYPNYGFEKNMGYGTAVHLSGLDQYGVTPWHRRSFAPVKERLERRT
ncbi:ribonuclease HII [Peribacillus psychrosaccharolyticus]|uniref:Ribonuclease HII n=1 Tax=Peribacillus psychrosaccharolyticus TaxID=1407 RepID=A0A974NPJ2_PERPY|nr:ribonuclease HII [Peribacillus psychrosaccharolyticus]MEC2053768.1 ribonuclease HII [Peribacillus psychrosaccharolyticus]MED3742617.1 ribonuclease HII [Peribacillus psychrosaccharolyticus]QQT01563.1 ribonuclease HII [Peribacillus psychrosaccharolyticus]